MNSILAVSGALGGLAAFGAGIWALLRGIFRQVGATEDNTQALHELRGELTRISRKVDDNSTRLTRLEARRPR